MTQTLSLAQDYREADSRGWGAVRYSGSNRTLVGCVVPFIVDGLLLLFFFDLIPLTVAALLLVAYAGYMLLACTCGRKPCLPAKWGTNTILLIAVYPLELRSDAPNFSPREQTIMPSTSRHRYCF